MFHLLFSSGNNREHKDGQRLIMVFLAGDHLSTSQIIPTGQERGFSSPRHRFGFCHHPANTKIFSRSVESPNPRNALPQSTDKTVTATSRPSVRLSLRPGFLISNPGGFPSIPGMFPQVYFPYLNPRSSLTDNL